MAPAQLYMQRILLNKYEELKLEKGQLSLRAFAKYIQVSPASLSEFLKGKRSFSKKMMHKVANNLDLTPTQLKELLEEMGEEGRKKVSHLDYEQRKMIQIQNDEHNIITDPDYLRVKELIHTEGFKEDYTWIGARLGMNETKAKEVVEALLRNQLFGFDEKGNIAPSDSEFTIDYKTYGKKLRVRHTKNFSKAKEVLREYDPKREDIQSLTLALNPKQVVELRKVITEFLMNLDKCVELYDEKPTEVYEVLTALFPVTQNEVSADEN